MSDESATKIAVFCVIGYAVGYWSLYALGIDDARYCISGFVDMAFATFWYRFCLFIARRYA